MRRRRDGGVRGEDGVGELEKRISTSVQALRKAEVRRIPLPRLSEKGYEQRSEREFGRAGRQKWVEKCRFGAL